MSYNLKNHIARFVRIEDKEFEKILEYFTVIEVPKKHNLLVEGNISKYNYFVSTGCLRLFFIKNNGTEQTVQFALENWWLADYTSFSTQLPSEYYIQAVEDSSLLAIDFESQEKLLADFPVLERYFRLVHQRAHAASQSRIRILYSLSREELYHLFSKRYPHFVKRIPQYLLASFLGFTPEYLSEIRGKKLS